MHSLYLYLKNINGIFITIKQDKFKFIDDLSIFEITNLITIWLSSFNVKATKFLSVSHLGTRREDPAVALIQIMSGQ